VGGQAYKNTKKILTESPTTVPMNRHPNLHFAISARPEYPWGYEPVSAWKQIQESHDLQQKSSCKAWMHFAQQRFLSRLDLFQAYSNMLPDDTLHHNHNTNCEFDLQLKSDDQRPAPSTNIPTQRITLEDLTPSESIA
jgi:hypothetical protein